VFWGEQQVSMIGHQDVRMELTVLTLVTVQTPSLRTMMGFAALYPSYGKNKEL
jgi:hypothetical protein